MPTGCTMLLYSIQSDIESTASILHILELLMQFQAANSLLLSVSVGYYRATDQANNSYNFIDLSIKISHTAHTYRARKDTKEAWNSLKFLWRGVCKSSNDCDWLVCTFVQFVYRSAMMMMSGARHFGNSQTQSDKTRISFDTFCFLVLFTIFQFCQIT